MGLDRFRAAPHVRPAGPVRHSSPCSPRLDGRRICAAIIEASVRRFGKQDAIEQGRLHADAPEGLLDALRPV